METIKLTLELINDLGLDADKIMRTIEQIDGSVIEPLQVKLYLSLKRELVSS